jgi:hypothetical protein
MAPNRVRTGGVRVTYSYLHYNVLVLTDYDMSSLSALIVLTIVRT